MKVVIIFVLVAILVIPLFAYDVYALRQVAGKISSNIKPGGTDNFEWGLASDNPNAVTTVELSAEGEGAEFLSFEKSLKIEPLKTVFTTVSVNVPSDYPGGIKLEPHLIATEFGKQGGATVINIRMLKIVTLDIAPNDDPSLRVNWDELRAKKSVETPQIDTNDSTQQGLQVLQNEKPKIDPEPVVAKSEKGGGCLIATATYGTELAPQVQMLREIRDNTILGTSSGQSFMAGFNDLYYSFSPTVSDWERQNHVFKEGVRLFITPMVASLSLMTMAEPGSELQVVGFGISVIMLNLGMYVAAPVIIGFKVSKRLKSRKY